MGRKRRASASQTARRHGAAGRVARRSRLKMAIASLPFLQASLAESAAMSRAARATRAAFRGGPAAQIFRMIDKPGTGRSRTIRARLAALVLVSVLPLV